MREKLTLSTPIMVDGKSRKTFHYDIDKITGTQFLTADAYAQDRVSRSSKVKMAVAETDNSLHYYLGIMAVIAEEPELDIADLERISGRDIMKIYRIGRSFTQGSAEAEDGEENPDSAESSSDEPIEDMPESITAD